MKLALDWLFRVALLAAIAYACFQLHEIHRYCRYTSRTLDNCSTWGDELKVKIVK